MSYSILILLSFLFYSSYVDTFSCKSDNLSVVRVPFSREKCTNLSKMHNSMPKKLQETIFRIPEKTTLFVHVYHPYLFYQCSVPPISSRDFKKKHIMLRKNVRLWIVSKSIAIQKNFHQNIITQKIYPLQENFKQASKTTQPESCPPPPSHPRLEVLRF